jgi:hypothetical protein
MVVRRRKAAPAPATAPKKRVAAPASAPTSTIDRALKAKYNGRKATDYQRQFARWLVTVVGVKPNECENLNQAFLLGLQMGIVSRPDFMASDFLRNFREENGLVKPGRLPQAEEAVAPENDEPEEVEEDEFDDEPEDDEETDEDEDEDEDEEEEEEDDDEEEDDEPEPEPVKPVRRARKATPAPARSAAPKKVVAKKAPARKAAPVEDDDFF